MLACACCLLLKVQPPISHTEKPQHVCTDCVRHWGKHERMNQDHLAAWQEVAASLNQKLQESRATANAQAQLAEDRRVALEDAMRLPVDGFFQNGNVSDELRNVLGQGIDQTGRKLAQQAFRQRDRGMNAILSSRMRTPSASALSRPPDVPSIGRLSQNSTAPTSGRWTRLSGWTRASTTG